MRRRPSGTPRLLRAGAALLAASLALPAAALRAAHPLGESVLPAGDYVMAKLAAKPVVILGEAHWIRHDAELVAELVPRLAEKGVVLAIEMLRASDQEAIDRLIAAPEWSGADAMRLMRSAAWPYREYLEILRASWEANRAARGTMRLLALGPDPDWRESLFAAQGTTYDRFMADRVAAAVAEGRRVLVYCGVHHAFTRYHQPELDLSGRATAFMDRMGNILRRRFGDRVFLITLHRPWWCGREPWSYCLPLAGAIDCLALGSKPIGFDVAGSPVADLPLAPDVYYAHGYASLRLAEMTDGYLWLRPIEEYQDVRVIPLDEFAPDEEALRQVARRNPFSDENAPSRERLEQLWTEETSSRADPLRSRRWEHLPSWRDRCPPVP